MHAGYRDVPRVEGMSMIVTMLWHGGSSYAVPTDKDAERFASLKERIESKG